LRKKKKAGWLILSNFKTYYKATVIKTIWYRHKDRHNHQWNRIEDLNINSHIVSQLIFDKNAKKIQWEKSCLFNKWCWYN
jgi:hypothetical protein